MPKSAANYDRGGQNKGAFPNGQFSLNGKSRYYDTVRFLERAYQSVSEALGDIVLAQRTTDIVVIINTTGTIGSDGKMSGGKDIYYRFTTDLSSLVLLLDYNELANTPSFKTIGGQSILGIGDIPNSGSSITLPATGSIPVVTGSNTLDSWNFIVTNPNNIPTNDAAIATQKFVTDRTGYIYITLATGQSYTVPTGTFIHIMEISTDANTTLSLGTTNGGNDILDSQLLTTGNFFYLTTPISGGITIYATFTGGSNIHLNIKK